MTMYRINISLTTIFSILNINAVFYQSLRQKTNKYLVQTTLSFIIIITHGLK